MTKWLEMYYKTGFVLATTFVIQTRFCYKSVSDQELLKEDKLFPLVQICFIQSFSKKKIAKLYLYLKI